MSGGSFNYLCNWDPYPAGHDALDDMASALEQIDASRAAVETRMVIAKFEQLQQDLDRLITPELRAVWKAVEWHRSCDWGEDQRDEAIVKYEREEVSHGPS